MRATVTANIEKTLDDIKEKVILFEIVAFQNKETPAMLRGIDLHLKILPAILAPVQLQEHKIGLLGPGRSSGFFICFAKRNGQPQSMDECIQRART